MDLLTLSGTAAFLLLSLTLSCVIPSAGSAPEAWQMSIADTVAPFGNIKVMFSSAIEDSTVMMRLQPNNITITATMNKTNDTALLVLPLSISGNSDFMLISQFGNSAQANTTADTLIFHTWPRENEPNNSVETADSIYSRIYGTISTVDDIDWYLVDSAYVTKCRLRNYGGTANLRVARKPGTPVYEDLALDTEIVTIPDNIKGMAYIIINTPLKSAGGYYEITILR